MRRRIAGSLSKLFDAIQCIVVNGNPAVRTTPSFSHSRSKIDIGLGATLLGITGPWTLYSHSSKHSLELESMKGGGFSITHRMETIEPWRIDL